MLKMASQYQGGIEATGRPVVKLDSACRRGEETRLEEDYGSQRSQIWAGDDVG